MVRVPFTDCFTISPSGERVAVSTSCRLPSSLSPGTFSTSSRDLIVAPACSPDKSSGDIFSCSASLSSAGMSA